MKYGVLLVCYNFRLFFFPFWFMMGWLGNQNQKILVPHESTPSNNYWFYTFYGETNKP